MLIIAAYLSLFFIVINLAFFIALHFYAKEYSFVSNAVSDYAVGKSSTLFLAYLVASMLAYMFLAISIYYSGFNIFSIESFALLLTIFVLRIGLSIFKTDLEGQKLTKQGLLHYIFAVLSFTALYVFVRSSITDLKNVAVGKDYQIYFNDFEIAYTAILVFVCLSLIPKLRKMFGLFERLFLVLGTLWVGLVAILQILIKSAI